MPVFFTRNNATVSKNLSTVKIDSSPKKIVLKLNDNVLCHINCAKTGQNSKNKLFKIEKKMKLRWPPEHTEQKLPIALELTPETNKISRAIQVSVLT